MLKANANVTVSARRLSLLFAGFVSVAIIALTAYGSVTNAPEADFEMTFVTFGEKRFQVEIADTNEKRSQGLGGRQDIGPDEGMLFIFEQPGEYCFWMKDVNFSLDIFWFNESYEVVEQVISAQPESYPSNFCPDEPAKYVLEIRGGEVKSLENPTRLTIEHML